MTHPDTTQSNTKQSPPRKQLTLSGELVDAATLAPATGQALAFGGDINRKIIDLKEYELTEEGRVNPFNTGNKPLSTNWVQNLLKRYDVYQNINNLELYQQACVHTSYTIPYVREICMRDNVGIKENPDGCMLLFQASYERMEFLGDTIIDAIIGNYVFTRFPSSDEGFLSTMKKQLISRWTLGHLAEKCGLGEYMIISKTLELKQDGRKDIKRLCDVFEAFVGAIYLDFNREKHGFLTNFLSGPGFQVAEKFVINLIEHPDTLIDMTSLITDDGNYKIKFKNWLRRMRQTDPIYTVVVTGDITVENGTHTNTATNTHTHTSNTNSANDQPIPWTVRITSRRTRDQVLGQGQGRTQKDAEYAAALDALQKVGAIDVI
jgi:dsRNA-specific ribonuclease